MPRQQIDFVINRVLSKGLFDSRWIMVPFYIGIIIGLLILLLVFFKELFHGITNILQMNASDAIIMLLSLIDLSLVANLALIVTLAGYENFVSKIETEASSRPAWMGTVDFAGMKMKLMASITAISSIALLRLFMKMSENISIDPDLLQWMVIVHLVLLASTLLLAATDWMNARHGLR